MAMAHVNLTVLGADLRRRRQPEHPEGETSASDANRDQAEARVSRHSRRPTSYYNAFQTTCAVSHDTPPKYTEYIRLSTAEGQERLPAYSCTVGFEAKVLLNLESISPLHGSCEGEWREVFAVVRGPMISFHRVKDAGAGKLLRTFTLQHAEVGMAPDAQHTVLVPQTRLANLVPSAARRRAWQKDPDMFRPVKQTILRLRAETDQILLAHSAEEHISSLLAVLSAAIDISQPVDERSIPKQCTVPRRRRRPRPHFSGDLADPTLLAEQERIFRNMYPGFAGNRPQLLRTETAESHAAAPQTPAREEDEVDLSMIREEIAAPASTSAAPASQEDDNTRPMNTRQMTSDTINSTFSDDMMYATSNTNFSAEGKWRPPHTRSAAQVQRYIRRCMPILLADAPRASDIVIAHGRRMKVNWRMELLEEWDLQPPTYKAHNFNNGANLARCGSQRSVSGSTPQIEPRTSSSILAEESDQILPVESGLEQLQLSKVASNSTKSTANEGMGRSMANDSKFRRPQSMTADIHGVVFCF